MLSGDYAVPPVSVLKSALSSKKSQVMTTTSGGNRYISLNTKVKHWTNEEDDARAAAQQRLENLLGRLRAEGLEAGGDIGDADPVQAMEDALRLFPANEVIISTHPPGRSNWLEREVVERATERFDLPVTHVVVDLEQERAGAGA